MHQKLLKYVIGLVLSTSLVGCGSTTGPIPSISTPISTSLPSPKAGHWEGKQVSFIVTEEGTVTDFNFTVGNCEVNVSEEIVIEFGDSLGSFVLNPEGALVGDNAKTATDFSAKAKFDSETSLSGTHNYKICGGFMNLTKQTNDSWTAVWQEP